MRKNSGFIVLKKFLFVIGNVLFVLFTTFCVLICVSIIWMFKTWPYLTMEELMFQLQSPMEGTGQSIIRAYQLFCFPVTILFLIIIIVFLIKLHRRKRGYIAYTSGVTLISVMLLTVSFIVLWNRLDVSGYIDNDNTYSDFIDENYVDPYTAALEFPEKKRNLIYIFLESMEDTYANKTAGGAFDTNYIPELTELANEYEDFSGNEETLNGGIPMNYTTWTMAALFAQTSGLPLTIPIDMNDMDTQETFMPEMSAIGDILEEQGYNQTFMIGSYGNFGGRKQYFLDHGNYSIKDYEYYENNSLIPKDYWVWWGFEDKKLFDFAKEELNELSVQNEPFNLTLLTVDTHFEDGYICDLCTSEHGKDTYGNVLSCSSRQVYDFIQWVQQQDFYENTTIVISGDHLTMDSDFCKNVDADYTRKVYTTYINSAVEPSDQQWRREYTTFDNFPTTLASLGVKIEGERLGLGTNLFSDEKTLIETYGKEYVNSELLKRSELMDKLTKDIDENSVSLQIREGTAPTGNVTVCGLDNETSSIKVVIDNFENIDNGISMISVGTWTDENQADLQWFVAEPQEDGSYVAMIDVSAFGYKNGEYFMDVWLVDNSDIHYPVINTSYVVQ